MAIRTLLVLFFLTSQAWATTVTFQNGTSGYTGGGDASIASYSNNENNTTNTSIRALSDGELYIIYFNVTTIPTNAIVSAATITIYQSEQNCANPTIGVRQIQDPDASGLFYANSSSGDTFNTYADWLYKNHSSTTKWSSSGGSANFTDVNGNSDETTQSAGSCPGFIATTFSIPIMTRSWIATPSTNAGMVFSLGSSGKTNVVGDASSTTAERPTLSVTYIVPSSSTGIGTINSATLRSCIIN